jgi:PIN domain nuclease of toxin-antitoxin system
VTRLLLDSNALFYYLTAASRFGRKTLALLESSELHFSAVSLVELKLKMLAGKLRLSSLALDELVSRGLKPVGFSVDSADLFELIANTDPFDNMLLAQAKSDNFLFLTSDLKILGLGLPFVLDLTD